jgi:hypothetical protein
MTFSDDQIRAFLIDPSNHPQGGAVDELTRRRYPPLP